MTSISANASIETKIRLLGLTFGMEVYTICASTIGMLTSNSVVFMANFVIALTGALGSGLSMYTILRMKKNIDMRNTYGYGRLETMSSIIVGMAMCIAAVFILFEAIENLIKHETQNGGIIGLILTMVSMSVSIFLWIRNYRISKLDKSPVFDAIWRMARMGSFEDLLIISSVGLSIVFKAFAWAVYIDAIASILLLFIIFQSIIDIFSGSMGDLMDQSIEEYQQILIIRDLTANFDHYDQIHGIRTRRSGSNVFIEIFLEFNRERTMGEVYDLIERLEYSLKSHISNAQVMIIPALSPAQM